MCCVQLTDGLYAPHVEREQLESVTGEVGDLVRQLMGRLHQQHVQVSASECLCLFQSVSECSCVRVCVCEGVGVA